MNTWICLFIIFGLLKFVENANILAILPTPIPSHINSFNAILIPIAAQHKITYYGPKRTKKHMNITEKNLNIENYLVNFSERIFQHNCQAPSYQVLIENILWLNHKFFDNMYRGDDFQQLLSTNETYDLLITMGHCAEQFFQLSHKFNIPIVQVAPSIQMPWSNEAVGNPNFFATDISFITSEVADNFFDRFKKFLKHVLVMAHYKWRYLPMLNKVTKNYFPAGTPSVEESAQNTALLFVNYQSSMGYSRPNIPNVVEIGGLHCTPSKPLDPDLENFISGSGVHGVIYFSLGGTVKGSALPDYIKLAILNVFRKLPQRILWKLETEMTDLPENVKILKWVPQQDVLGHKKVRLFITQGGMLSIQEAVYHGVPLLTIPLILDQYSNAHLVEKNGYGLTVDFCKFTESQFLQKIQELLQNPRYTRRAKEVSSAMRDQDRTPSEKVQWWVNYVLRHKGASTLRPLTNNLSWIQFSEVDVYLTIIALILSLLYSIYIAGRFIRIIIKNPFTKKLKAS